MNRRDGGAILCSQDLDDLVTLQVWRGSGAPRLGIFNKAKEKLKPIRFSWLEDSSRILKMQNGRGQSAEYRMDVIDDAVRDLVAQLSRELQFRTLCLRATVLLQDLAIDPKVIMNKKDFALLPETKRRSLWLTDISAGKEMGAFLPCFSISDEEQELFLRNGNERYIDLPKGGDFRDIRRTGIVSRLVSMVPVRWYMPFQVAAIGSILGFSLAGKDGIDFSDALWGGVTEGRLVRKADDLEGQAKTQAACLAYSLVSLVRHWPYVRDMDYKEHYDSDNVLKGEGYSRKRRFDIPASQIGELSYVVTVYEGAEDSVAFRCRGNGRTVLHDGEMVFKISKDAYARALVADACNSSLDESYSVISLIRAWRTWKWCLRIREVTQPALMSHR
ncbi:MAG: hypothetical protein CSA35_09190 [Dethiosulfovibrio peptidovorans]|nr:MAG: hypothetical protein CSA35_09190 [Dethiosulfovibrio peptidovorans]